MHSSQNQTLRPYGYTIDQFQRVVPLGRSTIYALIKEGKLKTVLICGRRLIPASEAERLLNPNNEA